MKNFDFNTGVYNFGSFTFNADRRILTNNLTEEKIKMTTKEANLLQMFCENKNEIVSRDEVLRKIWGDNNYFNARTMDVYICKVKKYLKADNSLEIINIHGTGYKMNIL